MKKKGLLGVFIIVSLLSSLLALEIKEIYPVYNLKGDFYKIRTQDIYAYISTKNKIKVIDTIERRVKSTYICRTNKIIRDFVITKDKYGYILYQDGLATVDFIKADDPYFIKCLSLPYFVRGYNIYNLYLMSKENIMYLSYGTDIYHTYFALINLKYGYNPFFESTVINASSSFDGFSTDSHLFRLTSDGFKIYTLLNPKSLLLMGEYTIKGNHLDIKKIVYEGEKVFVQYDDKIDIVDITDIYNPSLIKTLSVKGKLLYATKENIFIADKNILKIINIENIDHIKTTLEEDLKKGEIKEARFYNNFLFLISKEGFDIFSLMQIPSLDDELEEFIKRLYKNILKREADEEGLNYWKEELKNGMRAKTIVEFFFESEEFKNQNLSDEEFLTRVYNTILSRNPDTRGYNYWMEKLKEGMSREELLEHFIGSEEFEKLASAYGIQP